MENSLSKSVYLADKQIHFAPSDFLGIQETAEIQDALNLKFEY